MPTELRGLPGLNKISDEERRAFLLTNAEKLKKYEDDPEVFNQAASMLYDNQMFKQAFGDDAVKKAKAAGYTHDQRNELLREKVINEAFDKSYRPEVSNGKINKDTGAGEDWEKIQGLSTDAKEELLNSEWKTPAQRRQEQKNRNAWYEKAIDFVAGEAIQQYKKESNQKILDNIYNNDADNAASRQAPVVSEAYSRPDIIGTTDEETKEKFKEAITPSATNRGIPEYASRWGDGTDVSSEMEDFSIDEMRQVLAKKAAYEATMAPDMAFTALNNDAKRYITAHQGSLKRFGLFAKDVGISAMSYTADKINGIYNLALAAEDWTGEKPTVYVDDSGNVLDPNKYRISADRQGNLSYQDENGTSHAVHKEQVDRRTLHNMGKNMDGSDADEGIFHLNPVYWTRAEQFGTLDSDEQKQYEKLGSSPYKVSYNPNDDTDLVYESFKMMSFGLADAASMLIPFGVGMGGRVLSTASNVGKVGRGLGKALDTTGKYLSAQTRVGQVAQGLAGAGGIAYAYQRGAFQETLQQNLANLEEANLNRSRMEIYDQYNNDKDYKAQVDSMVAQRAAQMKQEYLAQNAREGQNRVVDEKALDEMLMARASDAVHNELVSQKVQEHKNSDEYAAMQQEAIQSAGDAAWTSFWPEAIKYGLVNTVGYRKFLYTNPTGLKKSVSKAMKGLEEVATQEGKQRLTAGATQFGTMGAKAKKLGKIAGSQFWGGAWTNGTDDMMVDAAERINEDSYQRYLNAYENGEALADEYGFIDGLYSYWKGLNNSLGQETTRNAATVGGFGSIVSASPNMANIAHLATKEGRDAYRNNFKQRLVYETDENGFKKIKKDENGKPVTEEVPLSENWRERAAFFIQNGVLNTYYGAKQNERDLQSHADYVNAILDRYDDFSALKGLIASDIERQNAETIGDDKTMRFIHAFEAINALEALKNDKNDAIKFSSVIDDAQSIIEGASKLGTNQSTMSEEQISQLLSEYYSHNPGVAESDENHQIALSQIAKNAQKMQEAYKAFNEANEHISNYEKDKNIRIATPVRNRMVLSKALVGHWEDRLSTMQNEIGAPSGRTQAPEGEELLATVGGRKRAGEFIKAYTANEQIGLQKLNGAINQVQKKLEGYNKAQQAFREAQTSEERYVAEQAVDRARTEYEAAVEERTMQEDILDAIREKKTKLQEALDTTESTGKPRVLSAEEIMALDPASRATMMDPKSIPLYSKTQQKIIQKLEEDLKQRDTNGDPVQKIQDIAVLTSRISQAKDAYNRMSRNPDAAALEMERQTVQEAEKAYDIINERNAQILANTVQEIDEGLKVNRVNKKDRGDLAYRMLRRHSDTLLDIIDRNNLLPEHKTEIEKAREWSKVLTDIDAVVSNLNESEEKKHEISKNIDAILENTNTRDEIIANLESVIDGNAVVGNPEDFDKVLTGMAQLGYHRDATVLENRRQRKEREEAARKKLEEEKKKADDAAQRVMEESAKKPDLSEADKDVSKQKEMDLKSADTLEDFDLGEDAAFESKTVKPEEKGKNYTEGKKFYEKVMNSEEPSDSKVAANFTTIEAKAEKGEITAEEAWKDVKKWNPDINEAEAKAAIDYIIEKKASRNEEIRQRAKEKAEKEIGFHPGDIIQDGNGRKYTVQGYGWTGIEGDNKDIFVSSTIAGEPVIILKDGSSTIIRDSAGDFYYNWRIWRIQNWTKVESAANKGITPALLMEDDAESGSLDYGEMWTDSSTPEQGTFTAKRETVGKVPVVTFSIDGEPTSLEVTPEEYTMTKDAEEKNQDSEKKPFNVKSIERIDGDWFFEGNFAGQNEKTTVKVSKKFDLDKALDRQRQQRENAAMVAGVKVNESEVADYGEQIGGQSESLQQQAETPDNIIELNEKDNTEESNEQGEQSIDTSSVTLPGNAMAEQDGEALKHFKLVHKKGSKPNDSMNHFYAWLQDPNGETPIELQRIIDTELPQILKKNPHTKVKFMVVKSEPLGEKVGNTTVNSFNNISNHIFLVVDYDSNVRDVHNEDNGGVIEAAGKKYLIIGTAGYGNIGTTDSHQQAINKERQNKYNIILQIKDSKLGTTLKNNDYYRQNPGENYRVLDDVFTEIVPDSMIPGYIVKEIAGEVDSGHRAISEIIQMQNEREGTSLTLQDLKWGIQEMSQFLPVKADKKDIMPPRRKLENLGAAFVLVPAGNGKYTVAHIDARKYSELKEGDLKNRVADLLSERRLLAPGPSNYPIRKKAVTELQKIFYLSKDGMNILVGQNKTRHENEITLVDGDGNVVYSSRLDSSFNPTEFMDAFTNRFNPRVNITAQALMDTSRILELDEAGALDTDVVQLHTSGTRYSIYPVDINGKMIKPATAPNTADIAPQKGEFTTDRNTVWYNGLNYEYKPESKEYTYGNEKVTEDNNPSLYNALEFNRSIILGKRTYNYSNSGYKYYVMREGEHPVVVRQDAHNVLSQLSEEKSSKIIDDMKKEEEARKRAEAAKAEKEARKAEEERVPELEGNFTDEGIMVVNPETGLVIWEPASVEETKKQQWIEQGLTFDPETGELLQDSGKKEKKGGEEVPAQTPEPEAAPAEEQNKVKPLEAPKKGRETQSFEAILKKRKYKNDIYERLARKFPELGIDIDKAIVPSNDKLRQFLSEKGMVLDGIGTSDAAIKAWIDTIEKCR